MKKLSELYFFVPLAIACVIAFMGFQISTHSPHWLSIACLGFICLALPMLNLIFKNGPLPARPLFIFVFYMIAVSSVPMLFGNVTDGLVLYAFSALSILALFAELGTVLSIILVALACALPATMGFFAGSSWKAIWLCTSVFFIALTIGLTERSKQFNIAYHSDGVITEDMAKGSLYRFAVISFTILGVLFMTPMVEPFETPTPSNALFVGGLLTYVAGVCTLFWGQITDGEKSRRWVRYGAFLLGASVFLKGILG